MILNYPCLIAIPHVNHTGLSYYSAHFGQLVQVNLLRTECMTFLLGAPNYASHTTSEQSGMNILYHINKSKSLFENCAGSTGVTKQIRKSRGYVYGIWQFRVLSMKQ